MRLTRLLAPLALALALIAGTAISARPVAEAQAPPFFETFDGQPASPLLWRPTDGHWLNSEYSSVMNPYVASDTFVGHGTDCSAPPATHHLMGDPSAGVFLCNNHMMTSGAESMRLAVIPAVVSDVTAPGGATLTFDVSTLGSSERDWIEVWALPYEDDFPATGDFERPPLRGVKIVSHLPTFAACQGCGWFGLSIHRNGAEQAAWTAPCCGPMFTSHAPVSATVRTKFEFNVTPGHVRFRAPVLGLTWVDADVPAGLIDWNKTLFYVHHAAYTPDKGGDCPPTRTDCGHNTWHWDNVGVSPATPLAVRHPSQRLADALAPEFLFNAPGAPNSLFRGWQQGVVGYEGLQHSYDGGATWQDTPRYREWAGHPESVHALKFPVPDGTTRVRFRRAAGGAFVVGNAHLVSESPGGPPPPTATASPVPPTPTSTPSPTATLAPTSTTTPVATLSPTPLPSPTTTPPPSVCEARVRRDGVEMWLVKPAEFCQ